ncbi:hypothetical protein, partial [Flavihumibacter cheonanensis]|uniref:hypothetical protein n=1 Tax=Flavihumibacter cheonanensis TaxID=1442385 RepID=UPI001EF7E795
MNRKKGEQMSMAAVVRKIRILLPVILAVIIFLNCDEDLEPRKRTIKDVSVSDAVLGSRLDGSFTYTGKWKLTFIDDGFEL